MKLLLATSIIALSTGAVMAGAPVFIPAPLPVIPAPVQDWTGPYAGLQAGIITGSAPRPVNATFGNDTEVNGSIYGAHVGYNYDMGSLVLGGEIDYNVGQIDVEAFDGTTNEDFALAHLKARVGYDLGSVLVYGVAGMAYFETSGPGGAADDVGPFGGVGAEYRISTHWSAGAEYLYHLFDEFGDGPGDPDVTIHTFMARASYHF